MENTQFYRQRRVRDSNQANERQRQNSLAPTQLSDKWLGAK